MTSPNALPSAALGVGRTQSGILFQEGDFFRKGGQTSKGYVQSSVLPC